MSQYLKYLFFLLFNVLVAGVSNGQEFAGKAYYLIDSLVLEDLSDRDHEALKEHLEDYHTAKDDTSRLSELNLIVESLQSTIWEKYNHILYEDSQELIHSGELEGEELMNARRYLAAAVNNKGYAANQKGNAWLAVDYYLEAIRIYQELNDREGVVVCYLNSAAAYMAVGEIEKSNALDMKAMNVAKKMERYDMVSIAYKNIAMKLMMNDFYDEALENALASLKYAKLVPDQPRFEAIAHLGVGQVCSNRQEDSLASFHFDAALNYQRQYASNSTYASSLNAYVEFCQDRIVRMESAGQETDWLVDSTLNMLNYALNLSRLEGLTNTHIRSYVNMSVVFRSQGEFQEALIFADSAWALTKNSDNLSKQRRTTGVRYLALKSLGRYAEALEMLELRLKIQEKMDNSEALELATRNQLKLEHSVKMTADSLERVKEREIHQKELQNEKELVEAGKRQMWFLYVGLIIVAVFGFIMFNRFKVTNRQKMVIEDQKQAIEQTHQEIRDSINYAQRLQSAIFPAPELLEKCGSDHFILFQPKDVVSGDFYWMQKKGDDIYVAVADCTGHGVPGALVSVVCSNSLTRTIKEFGLTEPSAMLDKARELVIETFSQSGAEVKDGMDVSLCKINLRTNKLSFAGANNPLWIIRKNTEDTEYLSVGDRELLELKADRQPVGLFEKASPFIQQNYQLAKGDRLFLFTDGYADQFGGENLPAGREGGKKYKYKKLKMKLLATSPSSMREQNELLLDEFRFWKGSLEQIDDVCIMGVEV